MVDTEMQSPAKNVSLPGEITTLLSRWYQGNEHALHEVIDKVYWELRVLAVAQLKKEGAHLTLQTTALIHEAYLRMVVHKKIPFENRSHFYWFSGVLMRRIIVEYARDRMALKRGGGQPILPLDQAIEVPESGDLDLHTFLALDEAVKRLAVMDKRLSQVVEMRFSAGLEVKEISELLGISTATVKREWATAKHWLARELSRC